MAVLVVLGSLLFGVALVVVGADAFVDGLLATARRRRVSAFVLTVLLSGFELENLAAGVAANAKGLPGAAAGTFLGGTTFLALGVAGLGAVIAPIRADLPRPILVWTAVAPVPLAALAADGLLSRLDGALLVGWFAVAMVGLLRAGRDVGEGDDDDDDATGRRHPWLWLLGGLAALTIGGDLLGDGIRAAAARFGVSATLLGNTAVAAAVEAEELGRVAVPAKRGRGDLALGNVTGTIVHFVALNAGIIALVQPLPLDRATLALHLPVAAIAPLLLCLLLGFRRGLGRLEGGVLVALYLGYLAAAVTIAIRS